MARKVTQVSPKTVINQTQKGIRNKFWASGFKIDKYASGGETQHISTSFLEPQEVSIELTPISNWGTDTSTDRITMVLSDGTKLPRWKATQKGIAFFKTKELAEQYFLVATHNLFSNTKDVLKLHSYFLGKVSAQNPSFTENL